MSAPEYIDEINAYDLPASGLHSITSAGPGLLRLTWVVQRRSPGGVPYVTPTVHVVIPECALQAIVQKLAAGVWDDPVSLDLSPETARH